MTDKVHDPEPRFARPSEAPAEYVCKACGKALAKDDDGHFDHRGTKRVAAPEPEA